MQRKEKQYNLSLSDLAYSQITKHSPYPFLNLGLLLLQYSLILAKLYSLFDPLTLQNTLPYYTIFLIISSTLGGFILLSLVSYNFQTLSTLWMYLLLLLQALMMLFVDVGLQCFGGSGWCKGDSKIQAVCFVVLVLYCLVMVVRARCYCPLYQTDNPISMKTGKVVIYTLIYTILISMTTSHIITPNIPMAEQIALIVTLVFFIITRDPPTSNPLMSRGIFVCGSTLLWCCGLVWVMPMIQKLIGTTSGSIWYYWGFSMPVIIVLSFVHSSKFNRGYQWQALFIQDGQQELQVLFLRVNHLIKAIAQIKKSELKTNSVGFRCLWGLITNHNEICQKSDCPLLSIKSLRIQKEDQILEHKRFNRTIQKSLEYGLQKLSNQHNKYPNLLDLSLQIANFQLQVFHLRTKGLQLFNRQYKKSDSFQKDWGMYYLKRKIQGFEGTGEAGIGQREQEIVAFKHGIEVSVTMLAEFWYFLSDPKCNIKKLYDLANVLFPLKIGVDESWKPVKQLKNIECYHLYAKYLVRMFNDKEKGMKILEEARRIEVEAHQKEEVLAGSQGIASQQHGVIFLQFDGKNSGIMYQVNNACQKMFGYNKGELQGRKVNDIMPRLIAYYHDRILQNYQQTNRPRMMNKDRQVWGRAKDGFLFPFTICIKPVRNYFSQTSEVYASLKRDLWLKQKAFFFTDGQFHLTDLSASMIMLFPEVANKIHLKRKILVSELIPDYETIMPRLIDHKQTHQITVVRKFHLSQSRTHTQTITFGIQAEQVSVGVAGSIGYYFKLFKGSGLTTVEQSNPDREGQSGQSRVVPIRNRNNFRFIGGSADNGRRMVFLGGIAIQSSMFKSQMLSRITDNLQKERQFNRRQIEGEERLQYGKQIKIKRLQGTIIREVHEMSEESQLNGHVGPDAIQEELVGSDAVKPSELNAILERESGNRSIFFLKLLTVVMVGLSTLLIVLEYSALYSNKGAISSSINTYSSFNSLHAQIMFLNLYSTRLALNSTTPSDLLAFTRDVNQLDRLSFAVPLSVTSKLSYSDGSQQAMLLAFAVNKLISEAQVVASGTPTQGQIYFLQYNGVNGLDVSCQKAQRLMQTEVRSQVGQAVQKCTIYLIISCCLFLAILIIKNIVLRKVIEKKAQILNIFFEIPRNSCSSIQKQCERFIQRLSADSNEDQLQMQVLQSEQQDEPSTKRRSQQKKRTIMGEQKTSTNFIVVSLLMLCFLVLYPTLSMLAQQSMKKPSQYVVESVLEMIRVEKEMVRALSFMNTHMSQPSYALRQQPTPIPEISKQHQKVITMLNNITSKFFSLGSLMDSSYLNEYNRLYYGNLCNSVCLTALGQDLGLNNIVLNYYDYLIQKYQSVIAANGTYNLATLYPNSSQQQQDQFLSLMKTFWRQLSRVGMVGTERLLLVSDSYLFGVMLTIGILNCTIFLWAWISFYGSLQKKMIATEYILTFIPIDQINKNSTIVKYIKEQVLRLQ